MNKVIPLGVILILIGIVAGVMYIPDIPSFSDNSEQLTVGDPTPIYFEVLNSSGDIQFAVDNVGNVGALGELIILGNITSYSYFIGDGSLLTGIITNTSNWSYGGIANPQFQFKNSTDDLLGYIDETGNLAIGGLISSSTAFYTDGSLQAKGNIEGKNITALQASNGYFVGNGTYITDIPQYQFLNNNFNGSGNFTTTGNIIVNGLRTSGQVWINDTKGSAANMGNLITHLEEMSSDTLLDKSRSSLSCSGGVLNYTLYAIDGVGDWNFNGTIYAGPGTSVANATIELTCGTDITPKTNYIYWELVGGVPTMKTAETYPSGNHIDTATFIVGACSGSDYTIYSYNRNRYEVDTFIKRSLERWEEMGSLYVSGFITDATTTNVTILSGGEFFNNLVEFTSANNLSVSDGFYFVNSSGNFVQGTSLANFTQYADGTAFSGVNERVNIVWGVIPISTTSAGTVPSTVKLVALLPNYPGAGYTYQTVATAISDNYDTTNYYPSNQELKRTFVPIARTILRPNADTFAAFPSGKYYLDIRGKVSSGGGAATPVDLSGYVPYTAATSNLDMGLFNITATKFIGDGSLLTGITASVNNTNINITSAIVVNNVTLGNTCTVWKNSTGTAYGSICGNGTALTIKVS